MTKTLLAILLFVSAVRVSLAAEIELTLRTRDPASGAVVLSAAKITTSPSSVPTYTLFSTTTVEPHIWLLVSYVASFLPVSASKQ